MINLVNPQTLLISFQRALLGEIDPQLRQASIMADSPSETFHIRFEYDGHPSDAVRASCTRAAERVRSDFSSAWRLDTQHVSIPAPLALSPLVHIAYRRAEPQHVN